MKRRHVVILGTAVVLGIVVLLVACGGGGSNTATPPQPASVSLSLSDPTTCSAPASGPYQSIFIAVTDVQIHTSSTAGDNDPNWVDLTPSLKNSGTPQQVDLLGIPDNNCFLKLLGSNTLITAGTYQQVRIFLADNTAANAAKLGSANKCGPNAVNCVMLASNPNTPFTLQLSSEVKTGIKIPSGQLAGGNFTVGAGQVKDLNIDIDSCASIVVDQGNGQFRLKPVLHAGEVSLQSAVTGTLMDTSTTPAKPVTGGKAIVALEQKDSSGVDRVIMQTTADPVTGQFSFCPVSPGTYDVVAVAVNGSNVVYSATITTGVQAGTAMGNIPMTPVPGTGATAAPGSITGTVTTLNASSSGTAALVLVSALQTVNSTTYTIPAGAMSAVLSVLTATPGGTGTYNFTQVPTVNPMIGAFSASPATSYASGTVSPSASSYVVEGQAFLTTDSNTTDCSPSTQKTTAVTVTASALSATANLPNFTGCQ